MKNATVRVTMKLEMLVGDKSMTSENNMGSFVAPAIELACAEGRAVYKGALSDVFQLYLEHMYGGAGRFFRGPALELASLWRQLR